jgi:hypothetical protein
LFFNQLYLTYQADEQECRYIGKRCTLGAIKMNRLLILTLAFLNYTFVASGQQKTQPIKLDYFNSIPSQIDGCSGLYTYDSTSLKKKKYIVVTDLQEVAIIKVDGKQIALKRTSNAELSKDSYRSVYKGSGYTMVLTTKTLKQSGDEVWIERGSVDITHGQSKVTIKIHGESGC